MNCHKGLKISSRLIDGGMIAVLIACAIGGRGLNQTLAVVLLVAGVLTFAVGAAVGYRFVLCPHCGEPLYEHLRLPSCIPDYCPHCGQRIEKP